MNRIVNRAAPTPQLQTGPIEDDLQSALIFSFILHILLFIFLAVRTFYNSSEPIQMDNVMKVDLVAMPDKIAQLPKHFEPAAPKVIPERPEKKPPEPAPVTPTEKVHLPTQAKPAPAPPSPQSPQINLKNNKRAEEAALKRLEALEKLKDSLAKSTATEAEPAADQPVQRDQLIKGNTLSQGTSLKGIAKIDYQHYNETVHAHIQRFWSLPQWMANGNLSVVIRVYIDAAGAITKKTIVKSSGRQDFDEKAVQALDAAVPLPQPPSNLVDALSVDGMQIEMSPD